MVQLSKCIPHFLSFRWLWIAFACLIFYPLFSQKKEPAVKLQDGKLAYRIAENGDRLVDFSYAGYHTSDREIPWVAPKIIVDCQQGDQTARIQRAIDYVSKLPLDQNGFRGAIQLSGGTFELDGGLIIAASGIVIRGSGVHQTTLLAKGLDRTTVIRVAGRNNRQLEAPLQILNQYVPVGAREIQVENAAALKIGDVLTITRPSTQEWIDVLGMKDFGGETGYIGWKPNERNITWERQIIALSGNLITLNAPITTALDQQFGNSYVQKTHWSGRIAEVGIEHLSLQSTFDESNPKDEQHRWMAITLESLQNGWVRQVSFKHFAGSAVAVWNTASAVTVEDCKSLEPVSEIGGQRRYTFYTEGQQCLFQRLYAEYGYHDFGVGFMAAGPNAFVECMSYLPHSFSGAIDSWASGVLFDIVNVDGQALRLSNRGMEAQGAGWTAANSMIWQCSASFVDCPAPPTAMNYAYAVWSQFGGNGEWHEANGFLQPRSLFYGQLADRRGEQVWSSAHLIPINTNATSSPKTEETEQYVAFSHQPRIQLKDWIDQASIRNPISIDATGVKSVDKVQVDSKSVISAITLKKANGQLIIGEKLGTGNRHQVPWWRGNVRAYDSEKAKPAITRYVPGRVGFGLTDDLDTVVAQLKKQHILMLDHNYGLWYDRRRDDHERIRRMNGDVWAPFYEMPFARSGVATAWDGLSKYDLTKFNYWYWNRLRTFAQKANESGLVLYHQHYFQHNILEAGAHYADFVWRTANNVNNTPFVEPVNYAGDKRIFIADQFYDVSNQDYKALHQSYIRKCLDNFSDQPNVIHFLSEEYTGPLSFMQFWLQEIAAWKLQTGKDPLVALSATKDVQDEILSDPVLSGFVDVIDIKYWWYGWSKTEGNVVYAPEGGVNLAPRQHERIVKTPKETFQDVYKAVAEYRTRFPDKAVIYNTNRAASFGWAVFMAGGSLMNIPDVQEPAFLQKATGYTILDSKVTIDHEDDGKWRGYFVRSNQESTGHIFYLNQPELSLDLSQNGKYQLVWINPANGEVVHKQTVSVAGTLSIKEMKSEVLWVQLLNPGKHKH